MSQAAERLTSFSIWLRTGLWPADPPGDGIGKKYNPWHDERDGRFTFAGAGRHDGSWQGGGFTGGGGGSGGGAGASGSGWGDRVRRIPKKPVPAGKPGARQPKAAALVVATSSGGQGAQAPHAAMRLEVRNGYRYRIDAEDRTRQVSGTITLGVASKRSRSAQAAAGGADRLATDDGGYYIAARFNGPRDAFNYFAQDANFNRGGYRVFENQWARDTHVGRKVYVKITPEYVGHSSRPDRILVSYLIDGQEKSREFSNERQHGVRHGR